MVTGQNYIAQKSAQHLMYRAPKFFIAFKLDQKDQKKF